MTNLQRKLTPTVLVLLLATGLAILGSTAPLPLLGMTQDPDSAEVVLVRDGQPVATIVTAVGGESFTRVETPKEISPTHHIPIVCKTGCI